MATIRVNKPKRPSTGDFPNTQLWAEYVQVRARLFGENKALNWKAAPSNE